jgi:hypothetical protein
MRGRHMVDLIGKRELADLILEVNREFRGYPLVNPEVRKGFGEYYASVIRRVEQISR